MRLLHFANFPNMHSGSFIPFQQAVFAAAHARGWTTEAYYTDTAAGATWIPGLEEMNVPVGLLEADSRRKLAGTLGEILGDDDEPVIVHTHFTSYDIAAALATSRRGNCALFWHVHTVLSDRPAIIARNLAKFARFRDSVEGVFVPAANIGDGLVRRGARRSQVMIVPSPIDTSVFAPATPERRRQAREQLGIPEGAYALLHIGRAWELKGGDIYFKAVKQLRDEGIPVFAMTLRGGEPGRRTAAELGIEDDVKVLEIVDDMLDLYAAADCFVASSRGEGMPYSVVESLAGGIPVVASGHLPGHMFLAEPLEACTATDATPEAFAAAIRAMWERSPEVAARQASEGIEWVRENLDLGPAAESLMTRYEAGAEHRGLIA